MPMPGRPTAVFVAVNPQGRWAFLKKPRHPPLAPPDSSQVPQGDLPRGVAQGILDWAVSLAAQQEPALARSRSFGAQGNARSRPSGRGEPLFKQGKGLP